MNNLYSRYKKMISCPIYKMSYDFSSDYLKFIARSTYDSDLYDVLRFLPAIL